MKTFLMIGLLILSSLCLCVLPCPASARDAFVLIGGGPTDGNFNQLANGIAGIVPKTESDIKISVEGSDGSSENVKAVHRGDFDFSLAYASDVWLAASGRLPGDDTRYDRVLAVGYMYGTPAQLAVRVDGPIHGVRDLGGHSLAVGPADSASAVSAQRFFRSLGIWDDLSPQHLAPEAAAISLAAGKLDALWVLGLCPDANVTQAADQAPVRLIDLDQAARETGFYQAQYYESLRLPAETYPGQDEPAAVFQDSVLLITGADVEDDIVYQVTRAVWSEEGLEYMRQAHPAAAEMSLEHNFMNAPVPLARGAARFWIEMGVPIPPNLRPAD